MTATRDHVANIGTRGANRRRRNGYVWLVVAAGVTIALFATDAAREWRLMVAVPVFLAAIGLLQAREKT